MKVAVQYTTRFDVASQVERVFALLADVPRSASHFPGVDTLTPLGGNRFRWDLASISALNYTHRIVYACRYVNDDDQLGLCWTPVEKVGNSTISGRWRLAPQRRGTAIEFESSGELDVPLPALLRKAATPVVTRQFRSMVDTYHANLRRALEAE